MTTHSRTVKCFKKYKDLLYYAFKDLLLDSLNRKITLHNINSVLIVDDCDNLKTKLLKNFQILVADSKSFDSIFF